MTRRQCLKWQVCHAGFLVGKSEIITRFSASMKFFVGVPFLIILLPFQQT
jgi:hypothetical protein